MNIAFRIHATQNSGLGHLTRSVLLAKKCRELGFNISLFLDVFDQKHIHFIDSLKAEGIYRKMPVNFDPIEDASNFTDRVVSNYSEMHWVVVDHYQLGADWERIVKQNLDVKLLAVDDLLREHDCDVLLDYRWRGANTYNAYVKKIAKSTKALLGPKYALVPSVGHVKKSNTVNYKTKVFKLLISIGGGGDGRFLTSLIRAISLNLSNQAIPVSCDVVIGPFLTNSAMLLDEINQINDNRSQALKINPVIEPHDLTQLVVDCDLYLGAAGTTLYLLRAVNKPAVTFAVADNQFNDLQELADIGHYWHLNQITLSELPMLVQFVGEVIYQYSRVERLFSTAIVQVDDKGVERVASCLSISGKIVEDPAELHSSLLEANIKPSIKPVTDQDLLHYLISRNLDANRKNMLDKRVLPLLNHFYWWLKTQRQSFKLISAQNQTTLYIWHELKVVDSKNFLIGGWFVANEQVGIQEAMFALDWQIKNCEREYPDATWIAVIDRQNKTVKRLNDYFGFKEIDPSSRYYPITKKLFPLADETDFFYVYK
jgi:spore coat polysaccharide biosynthesis predicted glycosyltransferase SpsG